MPNGKPYASEVFDFHRHCDLEVRYTREGMTDCWVICGQGNRSTVPSCKLGCDCMDSHGTCVISEIDMLQKFGGPLCLFGMQEKDPTVF